MPVAVYGRLLQYVAYCCSVLQYVADHYSVLHCVAVCRSALQLEEIYQILLTLWTCLWQCMEDCCSVLHCVAVELNSVDPARSLTRACCSVVKNVTMCCRVLQLD